MPDIKKFPNIIEAMKYLEPGHLLTQCLERDGVAINYQSNMPVSMPDGRIALLCPSPNPNYYRGENGVYPSCKSSLYRIAKREDQICALAKTYEFMCFLLTLGEVQSYLYHNLWYDPWAIAQHYEFATPMIDLTHEIAVAAFFATHRYDRVTKSYQLMREGVGQIRWIIQPPMMPQDPNLCPIGVQPFSRPSNQYGYGYWIPEDDDFKNHSELIQFEQDYQVNYRLKNAMTGPETMYFPNEKIAQMASIIKNENVITNHAIDVFIQDIEDGNTYITPSPSKEEILDILKQRGVFLVDAPVICPEAIPTRPNPFKIDRKLVLTPAYKNK